jgi:3-hydroxyisobutyrate dehydrogenase
MNASVLSEIMSKSSGANWSLEKYNPWPQVQESSPASRGYTGGFATDLMMKDLGLALEAAGTQKTSLPLGGLATQLYRMHSQLGSGKLDFSSILNLLKNSGKQV